MQARIAILTVMLIIGLAYLMNYSGLNYTLGKGVASVGPAVPAALALPWLGLAVFLSGSDTSGNALFGNLQVVAARQARPEPGADRRHQLLGWRARQDDLAAEHRHRRLDHRPSRARRARYSRAPSPRVSSSRYCWAPWWSSRMSHPGGSPADADGGGQRHVSAAVAFVIVGAMAVGAARPDRLRSQEGWRRRCDSWWSKTTRRWRRCWRSC